MPARNNLISRAIASLFNGVSQQPATLRLPSQGEAQVNGYATVVDGLRKRPPTEHLAALAGVPSDAFLHTINRDTTEQYEVIVSDGNIQVYDLSDGSEKTVTASIDMSYLNITGNAKDAFECVTVADYTFIVNKETSVATKTAPTAVPTSLTGEDWYVIPQSGFGVSSLVNQARFYNQIHGSYQGEKQVFSDLPETPGTPSIGDVWKIKGADTEGFSSYYVIYTGSDVWEETHIPNGELTYDETTMPHALIRESDGNFAFKPFAWSVRKVGDDKSNPPATFTGRTIEDIFFYKNRLGFVTDENTVFSCAGDFGNFWRNTVVDLLDSDVVDVAVSTTKVSKLKYATAFNNRLMLFADQTQFSLNIDELLSPSTISIDAVTSYEMDVDVRPIAIGNDVYFITQSGEYSRVREYYVGDSDTHSTSAADVTAHVPRYLPKNITRLTGNANEDVLFALSEEFPNRVYVYKFYWNEDGKIQSAWNYWEFPETDTVLDISILNATLHVLVERGGVEGFLGTNLLTEDPNDFSSWSYAAGATVDSNTDYALDGTITASTLSDLSTAYKTITSAGVTVSADTDYVIALPVKKDTTGRDERFCRILLNFGGPSYIAVDLDTETGETHPFQGTSVTLTDSGADLLETPYGDYWMLWISGQHASPAPASFYIYPAAGDGASWIGKAETQGSIVACSARLEQGAAPSEATVLAALETINLDAGVTSGDLDYQVLLDRGTEVTGVYDGGSDWTTFTLPYPVEAANQDEYQIVRGNSFGSSKMSLIDPTAYTWVSTTSVRVPGDESVGACFCGQQYNFEYEFSQQFVKSQSDIAVTTGRLMLRTFVVYFTDTAFFQTSVWPYGTDDSSIESIVPAAISEFSGKTLGAESLILGTPQYHTGSYAFQIYGDSRDAVVKLINNTHVQSTFQSAEWEGLYHNRARAI